MNDRQICLGIYQMGETEAPKLRGGRQPLPPLHGEDPPARKVVDAAGGITALARMLNVDRAYVWKWLQPGDEVESGTGGRIPFPQQEACWNLNLDLGWGLTVFDILGWRRREAA